MSALDVEQVESAGHECEIKKRHEKASSIDLALPLHLHIALVERGSRESWDSSARQAFVSGARYQL